MDREYSAAWNHLGVLGHLEPLGSATCAVSAGYSRRSPRVLSDQTTVDYSLGVLSLEERTPTGPGMPGVPSLPRRPLTPASPCRAPTGFPPIDRMAVQQCDCPAMAVQQTPRVREYTNRLRCFAKSDGTAEYSPMGSNEH